MSSIGVMKTAVELNSLSALNAIRWRLPMVVSLHLLLGRAVDAQVGLGKSFFGTLAHEPNHQTIARILVGANDHRFAERDLVYRRTCKLRIGPFDGRPAI